MLAGLRGVQELAEVAYHKGEELRARLHVGARIAKSVVLTVGAERRLAGETIVPIKWEAAGTPGLFPRMEADLVLMPLEPGVSHLALRGVYEPPAGAIGEALDRMALHRVAEAAVKLFVDKLAAALEPSSAIPAAS